VDGLVAHGIEVRIASASHGALVAPGAARLGLSPAHVHGMEPALDDDGRGLPSLTQDTYGPGKATTVRAALRDKRPLLAFGDAVLSTDKELLALARQGVAVAPKGAHRQAALADDALWLFDPAC
jgi:phosphoserine phosphatase